MSPVPTRIQAARKGIRELSSTLRVRRSWKPEERAARDTPVAASFSCLSSRRIAGIGIPALSVGAGIRAVVSRKIIKDLVPRGTGADPGVVLRTDQRVAVEGSE